MSSIDKPLLTAIITDVAKEHGFSDDFVTINAFTDSVTDTLENDTKTEIIKAYLENAE